MGLIKKIVLDLPSLSVFFATKLYYSAVSTELGMSPGLESEVCLLLIVWTLLTVIAVVCFPFLEV